MRLIKDIPATRNNKRIRIYDEPPVIPPYGVCLGDRGYLSGEYITRTEKKYLRKFNPVTRGRRKFVRIVQNNAIMELITRALEDKRNDVWNAVVNKSQCDAVTENKDGVSLDVRYWDYKLKEEISENG